MQKFRAAQILVFLGVACVLPATLGADSGALTKLRKDTVLDEATAVATPHAKVATIDFSTKAHQPLPPEKAPPKTPLASARAEIKILNSPQFFEYHDDGEFLSLGQLSDLLSNTKLPDGCGAVSINYIAADNDFGERLSFKLSIGGKDYALKMGAEPKYSIESFPGKKEVQKRTGFLGTSSRTVEVPDPSYFDVRISRLPTSDDKSGEAFVHLKPNELQTVVREQKTLPALRPYAGLRYVGLAKGGTGAHIVEWLLNSHFTANDRWRAFRERSGSQDLGILLKTGDDGKISVAYLKYHIPNSFPDRFIECGKAPSLDEIHALDPVISAAEYPAYTFQK